VKEQRFILSSSPIILDEVELYLSSNGFKKTKKYDYYNSTLGLRLEDIHDENVIMQSDGLFFIDTVFYIDISEV
jgi:hypothetical protein